ncbi:hypothetical protein M5K25_006123 [Dendrobium thyrsiflorum]|uniref:Uncharacterized protein n=1 Tax=Dendrobium thyrsiflorum TaxID=117978 RepID=A0ABD0VB02_DENTH
MVIATPDITKIAKELQRFHSTTTENCIHFLSNWYKSTFLGPMSARTVHVLEEHRKRKLGQLKSAFEDRMSSMEEKFFKLEGMIKKLLDLHVKGHYKHQRHSIPVKKKRQQSINKFARVAESDAKFYLINPVYTGQDSKASVGSQSQLNKNSIISPMENLVPVSSTLLICEPTKIRVLMAAKKVDALEERLEGGMSQMKATMEDRILTMECQVSDLHEMGLLVEKRVERVLGFKSSDTAAGELPSIVTGLQLPPPDVLTDHHPRPDALLKARHSAQGQMFCSRSDALLKARHSAQGQTFCSRPDISA